MTATFTGPFAGLTNGFTGWSNHATGAGALKLRYDDGDPVAAMLWREMAGNCNYQLAQSRRLVWADTFIGTGVGSTDPTYRNTGSIWTDVDCIYAVTPALILTPDIHGDPPVLRCRVRARLQAAGPPNGSVRIYSVRSLRAVTEGWGDVDVGVTASITVSAITYPADADEGFLPAAGATESLTPRCMRQTIRHPASAGGAIAVDVEVLQTHLVLCAIDNVYIAAVEVWEQAPTA